MGVRYDLGDNTRIGRGEDNEIYVADQNVSRVHAEIVRNRMAYTIHDCESRNGVQVNGAAVSEKVLLKNDEIVVGNTVFLFNSDLNLQNARFSDNAVYFRPAQDETVTIAKRQSQLDNLAGRERESVEFLLRFAELFSAAPAPLAQVAQRLVSQIVSLFGADRSLLLTIDSGNPVPVPAAVYPSGSDVSLNNSVIMACIHDKLCLLSEEPAWNTTGEAIQELKYSTMVAPVVREELLLGVLVVEKFEQKFWSLRDLGLLQAVTRIVTGAIETAVLFERAAGYDAPEIYVSRSPVVREVYEAAEKVARANVPVLLLGESGTGKEILARHIHAITGTDRPFIPVNCSAIPANLFESEFFGYERGAFTGAIRTTMGKVEAAEGGTLFLDEIGELPPDLQPKLLRFIQDQVFFRVGGNRAHKANVRIIAATNTDLEKAVAAGCFRQDLWFRLNVVSLKMPALREHREDIGPIADFLLRRIAGSMGKNVAGISDVALALLQKHDWPGNIRELENAIGRAVILTSRKVLGASEFSHVEDAMRRAAEENSAAMAASVATLAEMEKRHILSVLRKSEWNQVRAAELLGVHRNTLRNKMADYGIELKKGRD